MKTVTLLLTASLMTTTAALANDGTSVGNGGIGARDAYLENLRKTMGPPLDISRNPKDLDTAQWIPGIKKWCGNAIGIIDSALNEVRGYLVHGDKEEYAAAEQMMEDSLLMAAQSLVVDPKQGGPMTKRLVDRGLIISQAMDFAIPHPEENDQVSKLRFLVNFGDFIVKTESFLDREWYIPYQYERRDLRTSEWLDQFQRKYVLYAYKQLVFSMKYFLDIQERWEYGTLYRKVTSIGSEKIFLNIAELMTAFVASDLENSIFSNMFGYSIHRLQRLSSMLAQHNLGQGRRFGSDQAAIQYAFDEMIAVAHNLRPGWGECRSYPACISSEVSRNTIGHRCWKDDFLRFEE